MLPLNDLAESWLTSLRARRSPATVAVYRDAWNTYRNHRADRLDFNKATVAEFILHQSETRSPSTARLRLTALKAFAKWLAREEDFDAAGVLSVTPPRLDEKVVDHLTEDQLRALLAACRGNQLHDIRDRALVSLFAETGLRASEMINLDVDDIDIVNCVATVVKGKGGRGRRVKFSPQTAVAIDAYLRARRRAGKPAKGPLWHSARGFLTYRGLVETLKTRAKIANIEGFHVHRLRHAMAVRWLAAGGTETGLMAQAGWRSRSMIDRYVKTAKEDLAAAEFDRLNLSLGDN